MVAADPPYPFTDSEQQRSFVEGMSNRRLRRSATTRTPPTQQLRPRQHLRFSLDGPKLRLKNILYRFEEMIDKLAASCERISSLHLSPSHPIKSRNAQARGSRKDGEAEMKRERCRQTSRRALASGNVQPSAATCSVHTVNCLALHWESLLRLHVLPKEGHEDGSAVTGGPISDWRYGLI